MLALIDELPAPTATPAPSASRGFSPLDRQTLRLLGRGLSSKAIAQHEGRSPRTVDARIARMRLRIGAASRVELVALALRFGLVA